MPFTTGHKINLGKKRTEEAIKKMSERMKGKKNNLGKHWKIKDTSRMNKDKIGKKRPPFSEKWRRKMSESHEGEKAYQWLGGISFEPYSTDWTESLRRTIRERDKYTCQLCNKPQGDRVHSVHHIDYDKKNCNPNNLITLCVGCNSKVNINRGYWTNYFKNLWKIWNLFLGVLS